MDHNAFIIHKQHCEQEQELHMREDPSHGPAIFFIFPSVRSKKLYTTQSHPWEKPSTAQLCA